MALNFPTSPSNGDTYEGYTYNASKGVWEINVVTPGIGGLVGVDIDAPATGQLLRYDGTNWANHTQVLNDISNVTVPTPSTGDQLIYNGSAWVNSSQVPYRMAAGSLYGGAVNSAVTFPTSRFSVAPIIVINNEDGGGNISYIVAGSKTATGFTFKSTVNANYTMSYIAIQMTSTTANG